LTSSKFRCYILGISAAGGERLRRKIPQPDHRPWSKLARVAWSDAGAVREPGQCATSRGVPVPIDVRLGVDRFETRTDWVVSRHSFSYGPHYDPANTRLGPLVSHNDDVLSPGRGFPEHAHRDLEIVTWVVEGALEHTDSTGGSGVVTPGVVGRLSTGAGVRHVEANPTAAPTRYVQMWILPDADGPPSYELADVSPALRGGGFVAVAGGDGALSVRCAGAQFSVARLPARMSVRLPWASMLHVFVARGSVLLSGEPDADPVVLGDGDAARITDGVDLRVEAIEDAELLVWALPA
jgi:redox-sensitive bicupin YhaK (pirin superfamily)